VSASSPLAPLDPGRLGGVLETSHRHLALAEAYRMPTPSGARRRAFCWCRPGCGRRLRTSRLPVSVVPPSPGSRDGEELVGAVHRNPRNVIMSPFPTRLRFSVVFRDALLCEPARALEREPIDFVVDLLDAAERSAPRSLRTSTGRGS